MAIEQFTFERGRKLNTFLPSRSQLEHIVRPSNQVEILLPGEYDLTPPEVYNPPYKHSLMVFDKGTGLYRDDIQVVQLSEGVMPIAVMTRDQGTGMILIHDIVRFIPNA